ncbi:MAG: AAA family ATPase [Alphaproteobacteria bacterium]|nr:AAA family ATPase [Alphaproteobacteria bacterium]
METFDSAPETLAKIIAAHASPEKCRNGIIVRDVFGRLTFVTTTSVTETVTRRAHADLAGFVDPRDAVVLKLREDSPTWRQLCAEPSTRLAFSSDRNDVVRLIDRRLAGEEWLLRPKQLIDQGPKRLIFYSLKGGVGRSTALCVTAADLADSGLKVLVVDLDLEAPGLGSLLLTKDRMPEFGVVDWFASAAVGGDPSALEPRMVATSDLTSTRAVVDVIPAAGRRSNPSPGSYLAKLARAYTPGSAGTTFAEKGFAEKLGAMIDGVAGLRSYDVVLIDARAGLHETSGAILLGLGARVLLFGVDGSQTFDDYDLLLSMLANTFSPESGNTDLRSAFKMVHAKAPTDPKDLPSFINKSWNLWVDHLYDEVGPDAGSDVFAFDLLDESGPHFPLVIMGDPQFGRFDPRFAAHHLQARTYDAAFGDFIAGVRRALELT